MGPGWGAGKWGRDTAGNDNVGGGLGSGQSLSSTRNLGSESNTPEIIWTKCGNKNGMYVVDFDMIYKYRCQFITN